MMDINYHKELVTIVGAINDAVVDASYIEIIYSDEIIARCNILNIETERIQNKLRLLTNSIKTKVFGSIETFLKTKEINLKSNFLIYYNSKIVSYIDGVTYIDLQVTPDCYLVQNAKTYLEFQIFLKNQEKELDGTFHFVDSYNMDLRKIIFVSLSEKGRLNITYGISIPLFDEAQDFSRGFERYIACFSDENTSLTKFLKSATINLVSNFPTESRFKQYFESLNEIVDKARMNFEVYLNELSIDKIKKDYDEVKSKYFNGLSDILSKLSQNIIALPIGIAAILFAIEKIKVIPTFLYLLIAAILITSIYISLLLRVHFSDLIYIQKVFNYDYSLLIENNFFKKYPRETTLFCEIKDRINDRVKFLKLVIESYFWIMNLANLFILSLLLSYLKIPETGILFIAIAIIIALSFARNYILDKTNAEEKNGV